MRQRSQPTWNEFDLEPDGFDRFYYVFDQDVEIEWGRSGFDALNEGRKMAIRFYWFAAELNNGGLEQYFWNSSGDFAADQIADFRTIGCDQYADLLQACCRKLFNSDIPSRNGDERRTFIQALYKSDSSRKDELRAESRLFDDAQQSLAAAFAAWFRTHPEYFSNLS